MNASIDEGLLVTRFVERFGDKSTSPIGAETSTF